MVKEQPILIGKREDFICANLAKVARSVPREKQGFEMGLISGQDIDVNLVGFTCLKLSIEVVQ